MSGTPGAIFSAHPAVALLAAFVMSVVLHELGHLLPSLWFGFYVPRVSLGPLSLTRAQGPWRLRYSRNWFSASVAAIPRDETAWRARMLIVVAGGPLASLLTFVSAAYLLEKFGAAASFVSLTAQLNLLIFLFGLVPNSRHASVRNDARLFLTLLENGCEAEQIKLYHLITQLQIAGVRPRDYPRDLIHRVAASTGNYDLMLFAALAVFLWALDSGDAGLAAVWDSRANELLEDHALRLRDTVLCESACFDIVHRGALDSAARKLRGIRFANLPPWLQQRAKAALYIAEGSRASALSMLQQARASLPKGRPYYEFEAGMLEQLDQRVIMAGLQARAAQAAA